MDLDVKHPIMRFAMIAFGLFFSGVGFIGFLSDPDGAGIPVGGVMVLAGLWIAGMGAVGVVIRNGVQVGGGPLLPTVKLEPGESVIADSSATYKREGRELTGPEPYVNLQGHAFVTDRRVIFSPLRFRYAARPVTLALSGASSLSVAQRSIFMMGNRDVLELAMKDGSTHMIWFNNVAARDEAMSRFERRDFVEAGTIVPDRTLRFHHVIFTFIASGAVVALILGSTSPPYVKEPDGILVWGLILFLAAMPLITLARWLLVNAREQRV